MATMIRRQVSLCGAGSDTEMDSIDAAEANFVPCKSGSSDYSDLDEAALPNLTSADTRARALHRLKRDLSFLNTKRTSRQRFTDFMQRNFGTSAGGTQHWIRTPGANSLIGLVIIINAGFIGVETDFNGPDAEALDPRFWFAVETAFLIVFISELVLRFRADRCTMFKDGWNVFDTAIVLLGVVDTWIVGAVFPSSEGGKSDLQTFTLFRLGRLVRIARILRVLRLLRFIRELLLLVKGLLGALKALIWAFLLIMMVLYLAAVFATELIGHGDQEDDPQLHMWFGSVGSSILSLSQLMTLEGWPQIVRYTAIDSGKVWLLFFFLSFLCCTNFALLNVVTAVMVEKVFEFAQDEKMQEAKRAGKDRAHAIKKIERLFVSVDKDASGSITTKELKDGVLNSEVTKQFQELGIAKHDIDTLFQCLDVDGNGELSVAEFIEGCLRMHGAASSKDLLRIQYDVHRTRKSLDIKKLTRHMTWSALCLHKDFSNSKTPSSSGKAKRKKTRAKTAGADERGTPFSGKASMASLPALPISASAKEGLLPSVPAMPGMEAPPAQTLPRIPLGSTQSSRASSGSPKNRPRLSVALSTSSIGQNLSRVRPAAPQQLGESPKSSSSTSVPGPLQRSFSGAHGALEASPPPSTRGRRASIGHSPCEPKGPALHRQKTDGNLGFAASSSQNLSLGRTPPNWSPIYRRTSLRARTVPSRTQLRRCDSDLTSSASNDTSCGSSAHMQVQTASTAPGCSDAMDFSLPPEGYRLLEEVQTDQQHMVQLLMTLRQEITELRRLSKPGPALDGSWSLKEEEMHVQLKVVVVSAQSLRNADTLPGQGVSDPYCICRLRGKPKSEWKTHVISDDLDPVWNCAQIMPDFVVGDVLEFEVMDKDLFKQDDMLGWATVPCSEFYPHGFKGTLPLRFDKDDTGVEGEITVHIHVLEKDDQTKDAKQEDACEDIPADRHRHSNSSGAFQQKGSIAERVGRSGFGWLKRSLTGDLGSSSSSQQKDKSLLSGKFTLKRGATGAV